MPTPLKITNMADPTAGGCAVEILLQFKDYEGEPVGKPVPYTATPLDAGQSIYTEALDGFEIILREVAGSEQHNGWQRMRGWWSRLCAFAPAGKSVERRAA